MNALHRSLFTVFLAGAGFLAAPAAFAQRTDTTSTVKPQLNTAPPGTAPRPITPTPTPAPRQQVPVPAPPPVDEPVPTRPSTNSPSGLELPQRPGVAAPPPPLRKYFLYTNLGLGYTSFYGDGQFNASIAPALGIRVTEKLAVGPGISYSYTNISYSDYNQQVYGYPSSVIANNLGLKAFAQYIVYKQFFLHAEYEVTRSNIKYRFQNQGQGQPQGFNIKRTLNTPLAGAGYRNEFSDRVAADIVVLYNFNDGLNPDGSSTSPYGQPEIRFNFLVNLGK
ncbi:hypothetical protein [Hymenobacter norwichensis]|uniref:hypothetical protein n=1 Tax=Hymenobacter norwichensis TaxID=223903 RepID=UPI0003B7211E|nr:hypothetical protein [Hymenobacter norwichensis]